MRMFAHRDEPEPPMLAPFGQLSAEREQRRDDRSSLSRQLGVVLEMLGQLEVQTVAGQKHTMEKIVAFLRQKVVHGTVASSSRNGQALAQHVEQLGRQAQCLLPDLRLFSDRAEVLVALLTTM
jgi:hypothetical protein